MHLAADQLRARVVPDRDEQAGDRQLAAAVGVSVKVTPDSDLSPWMAETAEFQAKLILGSLSARSAMILLARSLSRRCTIVTELANRVRKVASSTAESPPPTTAMSLSRKKKPSQVAHQDTPWPDSRSSWSRPSLR